MKVVSPGFVKENNIPYDKKQYEKLAKDGKTVSFIIVDDELYGMIALADQVKETSPDVVSIIELSKATYRKMVQNLWWAAGYNIVALPLAAGILFPLGILLDPAVGAILMSLSTVIVAFNAQLLKA